MSNESGDAYLAEMEPIREALAAWRGTPGRGQRIPEAVWEQATVLAKKYGIHPVCTVLKLSYSDLKRHVMAGEGGQRSVAGRQPVFIEVKPESPGEGCACVIELTKSSGTRLRISLPTTGSVDWCRIKEAFLGA
jgi:hypothetical protein